MSLYIGINKQSYNVNLNDILVNKEKMYLKE